MLFKYSLPLSILLFTNISLGKASFIPSGILQSTNETSSIEMFCRGEEPYQTMDCEFIQKSLRKTNTTPEHEIDNFSKVDKKELQKMETDLRKQCKIDHRSSEVLQTSLKQTQEQENKLMLDLCDCVKNKPFRSCFSTFIIGAADLKDKTCKIAVSSFTESFKKIGKNKWMNTPKPQGLCNNVNAITLEYDEKSQWTYTQTRLASDNDELCKFDTNVAIKYKSGPTTHKVNCEYVDLGVAL
ncbi:hypothetical protein [Bdellovibrio bacteriovorus]|uniref:hypothetical protein n=1 Tax=Bdellovibrio bacteriovorus TaxID=959 RepID=UPI003AA948C2